MSSNSTARARANTFGPVPAHRFSTSLGDCRILWQGDRITGFALLTSAPGGDVPPPWLTPWIDRAQRHLVGQFQDFSDAPYAWETVTSFQADVYRAALKVKSGQTATYGDLARAIGQPPGASRAVGTALGQNPWPLLVPCHRFVGAGGKMTGFSAPGGVKTKLKLLALEGSELFAQ